MTKHIHISLVGAQPIPIYNGIIYANPDTIILLHSKDTTKVAQNIHSVFPNKCFLYLVDQPFDFFYCKELISNILNNTKDCSYSINISGGTKLMTLAATDVARENKVPHFYIDQNNLITDFGEKKLKQLNSSIKLGAYFQLFGQSAKSTTKYEVIDEALFEIANTIANNLNQLNPLFKRIREKEYNENNSFLEKNSSFELEWKAKEQLAVFYTEETGIELQLQGGHIFQTLFNTGWFELIVAQQLNNWGKAQNIYWNTIIPRKTNDNIKNEIDIIVDSGTKMFFIECKTLVHDIKDLDKFRNVVKNFGGLAAKAVLVCMYRPNNNIIEKCEDNKISVFWYKDNKTKQNNTSKQLFELLDKEFLSINPI